MQVAWHCQKMFGLWYFSLGLKEYWWVCFAHHNFQFSIIHLVTLYNTTESHRPRAKVKAVTRKHRVKILFIFNTKNKNGERWKSFLVPPSRAKSASYIVRSIDDDECQFRKLFHCDNGSTSADVGDKWPDGRVMQLLNPFGREAATKPLRIHPNSGDVARLRRSCASFSAKNRPTHAHRTKKIHLNFSYKSHCSRAILAQNSLWKVTHGCLLVSPGANYLKVRNSCEIILVEIWKWTRKCSARAPRTGEIIPKVLWDFQLIATVT